MSDLKKSMIGQAQLRLFAEANQNQMGTLNRNNDVISQTKKFPIADSKTSSVVQGIAGFALKSSNSEKLLTLKLCEASLDRNATFIIGRAVGCLLRLPQSSLSRVELDQLHLQTLNDQKARINNYR